MSALYALIGFTFWTFLLIVGVLLYRGMRFLRGTPINHWPRTAKPSDDAPLVRRMEDAHANCLENLLLFAVPVLTAAATGYLPLLDPIAPWVLYARIGQTLAHLSGVGPLNVLVRATFWSVQLVCFGWMLLLLLGVVGMHHV